MAARGVKVPILWHEGRGTLYWQRRFLCLNVSPFVMFDVLVLSTVSLKKTENLSLHYLRTQTDTTSFIGDHL